MLNPDTVDIVDSKTGGSIFTMDDIDNGEPLLDDFFERCGLGMLLFKEASESPS